MAYKYSSIPIAIDEDTVFIPLTTAENINYIVDTQKISRIDAEKLVNEKNAIANKSFKPEASSVTYEDRVGIILKRYNVYTGSPLIYCEIAAAINVCVRFYSDSETHRKFMAVYDQGISLYSSNIFQWTTTTCSAVILPNGHLQLDGSGNVTATVDYSFTLDLEAAGFSVLDIGVSGLYYVTKFITLGYDFDPTFPGAILF